MTTKYGMFKERVHIPDVAVAPSDGSSTLIRAKVVFDETGGGDREKGLSMKATVGKAGKLNDAMFTKFISIHHGDKYIDTRRKELQEKAAKAKLNVTDAPFRAAAPMKKSVGAGDYYGTIEGKVPHLPEAVCVPKKKGEIPEVARGIFTNPSKKGTYGMNKLTLSERVGYKGVATEYEYQHDPDAMHKQRRMEALAAHHKACMTDVPFKPANPPKKGTFGVPNTTISKGKGIAGEWEYIMAPPIVKGVEGAPAEAAVKREELAPFVPTNAHVAKRLNHIPYIHDPEAPKMQNATNKRLEESKRLAVTGAWRPNMAYKTDMVRSVVKMNIPRC